MANEITLDGSLDLANGNLKQTVSPGRTQIDQGTARRYGDTQNIGTTHETLGLGSVTTPGWCYFRNLDATNFVEIGRDVSATFYPVIKLLAGEWCLVRLGTTAPYAKADTAAVELDYVLFET